MSTINDVRLMLIELRLKVHAQQLDFLSTIQKQQAEIEELKAAKKPPTPWVRSIPPSPKSNLSADKSEMVHNLKMNLSRVNEEDVIELKKQIRESLSAIDKELTVGSPEHTSDNTNSATYTTLELQEMLESLLTLPNYRW